MNPYEDVPDDPSELPPLTDEDMASATRPASCDYRQDWPGSAFSWNGRFDGPSR